MSEQTSGSSEERAEAAAALRKALGLERLLGRLRSEGEAPVATLRPRPGPRPRRAPAASQEHAHAAA